MRKYLIAAAAAGGLLLLGGAPAQAEDVQPAPAADQGGLLGGVLDPAGGVNPLGGMDSADGMRVPSPLDDNPLVHVRPGTNSVTPPEQSGQSRTGMGSAARSTDQRPVRKAAAPKEDGPLGGLPAGGGGLPIGSLPLLGGGGLPVIGGLMPNGGGLPVGRGAAAGPSAESGLLGSDLPLLGGLLPEEPARTLPADADPADDTPDVSGMPAGGTAVKPGDTPPATTPGDTPPPDAAGPGDDRKRLHEEPIDDEASTSGRGFSDGRPVAGEDPDYKD